MPTKDMVKSCSTHCGHVISEKETGGNYSLLGFHSKRQRLSSQTYIFCRSLSWQSSNWD